jgi:hypothetical protein
MSGGIKIAQTNGSFVGNYADFLYQGSSKFQIAYSSSTGKLTETYGATGSIIDYASATNGNTFVAKIPQKATSGTCASAAAEGFIYQNSGGTQVGHICIDGPSSGTPNKLRFYAEQFNATSTDVAENYSDATNSLQPGDLVMLDSSTKYGVTKANIGTGNPVIGVVSTSPGIVLTGISEADHSSELVNPKPIALSGRVPVKVSNENGAIKTGDFLTASSAPGVAMKATKAGPVIGQALANFNGTTGTIVVFIKATNYNGADIQNEMPGLTFRYADPVQAANTSYDILGHLMAQLPNLDPNNLSQVHTDVVVAGAEVVTPTVTTHTLRTDLLSAATAQGGLSVASTTVFTGGLKVDSIGSIGTMLSIQSDVEFFGIPYFTSDTAGFALIKSGVQSVDVEFTHPYVAQPIINATISFEQDINPDLINDPNAQESLKNAAITDTQAFLQAGISYAITNKSARGFTIVLNKPAPSDIKFSWISLAVRNAITFTSKDAPQQSQAAPPADNGGDSGASTPPAGDGTVTGSDPSTDTSTPATSSSDSENGSSS